ncbi:MAG: DUF115 domain-containing protein, partial [Spirochaetia bacterium]|nr:DUF115 domain-containing protein [Spirochaetia bacterium]
MQHPPEENQTKEALLTQMLARKPYLRALFETPNIFGAFGVERGKDGAPVIVSGGKPLSSRTAPLDEIKRSLPRDAARFRGSEIVIILGAGNPNFYSSMLRHLKENQICIGLEGDENLAAFAAQAGLIDDFLMRSGCHLFSGQAALDLLWHYLDTIPADRISGVRFMRHMPSVRRDPQFFEAAEERVRTVIRSRVSDLMTRLEFEKLWIQNTILNRALLPDAPASTDCREHPTCLLHWEGALKGAPAVLVAAGPSLRDTLDVIRSLQSRAFILACDTAARVLIEAGITPHAAITLDAQKHSLFHFLGVDLSRTILFADMVADPKLLRSIAPKGMIFSITARVAQAADGTPVSEATAGSGHIFDTHGNVGFLQSGGSVATTAFDLLRFLGAGSVLFAGQDLAYTGRRIHSPGTHHWGRWFAQLSRVKPLDGIIEAIIRKRHTFQVPSVRGADVLSDYVLTLYRRWFEDSVPRSGIRAVNLTRYGAQMEGVEWVTDELLESFISALPERP